MPRWWWWWWKHIERHTRKGGCVTATKPGNDDDMMPHPDGNTPHTIGLLYTVGQKYNCGSAERKVRIFFSRTLYVLLEAENKLIYREQKSFSESKRMGWNGCYAGDKKTFAAPFFSLHPYQPKNNNNTRYLLCIAARLYTVFNIVGVIIFAVQSAWLKWMKRELKL